VWTKVRALGELQVLTKASYVVLIIVPILGGMWPAVRTVINRYNLFVEDAAMTIGNSTERLEFVAQMLATTTLEDDSASAIQAITQNINTDLQDIVNNHAVQALTDTSMPAVWAFAFFASLSILVAHLIYQSQAPALVRKQSAKEHVRQELKQFMETPSQATLAKALSDSNYLGPAFLESDSVGRIINEEPSDSEIEKRRELTIIERGAEGEYLFSAFSFSFSFTIQNSLYSCISMIFRSANF